MKRPQGPLPTLAELQESIDWFWLYCDGCQHSAPIKFAPLVARWGAGTSSNKLRRCARCTACGNKGATLQHPGWVDSVVGFQPFPGTASDATFSCVAE